MNWTQLGMQDGAAGNQQRNLSNDIQDCQKFNLKVDTAGYLKGWKKGIRQYCSPSYQTGAQDGRSGLSMDCVISRQSFCQENGLVLKTARYKKGRLAGLKRYCTFDDGYNIGLKGNQPPQVCPRGKMRDQLMQGWRSGACKFCSQSINAFNIGKQDGAYPSACTPAYYPNFQSEYNRGQLIFQRIQSLQSQINNTNNDIQSLADEYHLQLSLDNTHYYLTDYKSHAARRAMYRANDLLRQKQQLQNNLFQAKIAR